MPFIPDSPDTSSGGHFTPDSATSWTDHLITPKMEQAPNPVGAPSQAAADYWAAKGDMPKAGAEVPGEQHVLSAFNDAGAVEGGIAGVTGLVKGGMGLAKMLSKAPEAAEAVGEAAPVAEAVSKAVPVAEEATKVTPDAAPTDPLQAVKDFVTNKYGEKVAEPGFKDKMADFLMRKSQDMGLHSLGAQPRQLDQLGPGLEGSEKARQLAQYAMDNGYVKPGQFDMTKEALLKTNHVETGRTLGAIRELADTRSPGLDRATVIKAVQDQLGSKYAAGAGPYAAPAEYQNMLDGLQKADMSHSGLAEYISDLNKSKTPIRKMAQSEGPVTDAANILSRLNNEAIHGVLTPEESAAYSQNLRDFGAQHKLNLMMGKTANREASARKVPGPVTAQILQALKDKVGYNFGANVANRMGKTLKTNPDAASTLPQFFEELANHVHDVAKESID